MLSCIALHIRNYLQEAFNLSELRKLICMLSSFVQLGHLLENNVGYPLV